MAGDKNRSTRLGNLRRFLLIEWAKKRVWLLRKMSPALKRIRPFLVTTIAAVLSTLAVIGAPPFLQFPDPTGLLGSVAAMIGGVLGLLIGLALIPIQRAIEAFTPSVARAFRNDGPTQAVFLLMSVLCVTGFVGSNGKIPPLNGRLGYLFGVISVGVVLDCLRFYFRRATLLLDPREVTQHVVELGRRHIHKAASLARGLTTLLMATHSGEEEVSKATLEATIQDHLAHLQEPTRQIIEELGDMAERGVVRNDMEMTAAACEGIRQIFAEYVEVRSSSILSRPVPEALGTLAESGLGVLLTPACESLQGVSRSAARMNQERACNCAVVALAGIAGLVIPLEDCKSTGRAARLSWKPLSYFKSAAVHAVRAGCDDVGIEASRRNLEILRLACGQRLDTDELSHFFSLWQELSAIYLSKGMGPVAELILRDWMTALGLLVQPARPDLVILIQMSLQSLETLIPMMLQNEEGLNSPFAPYNTTVPGYIAEIVDRAASLILDQEHDSSQGNPVHSFIEFTRPVRQHLRAVAESPNHGNTRLPLLIIQTLQHTAAAHLRLLDSGLITENRHQDEIISSLTWNLSACWALFENTASVDWVSPRNAADLLAWAGLHLFNRRIPNGPNQFASFICSITKSVIRASPNRASSAVPILHHCRYLALAAHHLGFDSTAQVIEDKIECTLSELEKSGIDLHVHFASFVDEWNHKREHRSPYSLDRPAEALLGEILDQVEPTSNSESSDCSAEGGLSENA